MLKRLVVITSVVALSAAVLGAQSKPASAPAKTSEAKTDVTVRKAPEPPPLPVNIKIDVSITDQTGTNAPAKKAPGKINFASVGMGSYPHLDMERLMKAAGIQLTHVPYKGGAGQAIPAMIGGEVQLAFFNMASLLPHIRSGRLKALAAIPAQRLPELPNVPTLAEQGYPGIGTNAWQGLFAPAATPKPVIDKLYGAVVAVLTRPEQKEGLAKQMLTVEVSKSPQEFSELVRRETQAWGEFVREAKIRIE